MMKNNILLIFILMMIYPLIASSEEPSELSLKKDENKGITFNFQNVEIRSVIKSISRMTHKNFLIDPRVKGKVTLISGHALPAEAAYEVFLSVLDMHGYATVEKQGVIKILPESDAKQDTLPINGKLTFDSTRLVTRIILLKFEPAAKLVPILKPLMSSSSHLAAYPRANLLIFTDREDNINRLLQIIQKIDQPGIKNQLEIIQIEHASANELVRLIKELIKTNHTKNGTSKNETIILADPRTNSILLTTDQKTKAQIKTLISHMDAPMTSSDNNTHVIYLRNTLAKNVEAILKGVIQSMQNDKSKKSEKQTINIQGDEINNLLIITAPNSKFKTIRRIVEQIDLRRAQVFVEALIAEVSGDLSGSFGINWSNLSKASSKGFFGTSSLGGISTNDLRNNLNSNLGDGMIIGYADGTVSIPTGVDATGNVITQKLIDIKAVLSALHKSTNTNILSTPVLMVMDNEEATLSVGQNVPFITGQFSNTGGTAPGANPFQTIERKDVGVVLTLKPQITESGVIRLDIKQEVSSVARSAGTGASDIITNKRTLNTSVLVNNGHIVVLGGLVEDNYQDTETKIPLLGDIPFLGKLFRNQTRNKSKKNLLVFIRAQIIRNQDEAYNISYRRYLYLNDIQKQSQPKNHLMFPKTDAPVLEPFNDVDGTDESWHARYKSGIIYDGKFY